MFTFSRFINEVAEPKSGDEKKFKAKHQFVKHTELGGESTKDDKVFNASEVKHSKRIADRDNDESVYEEVSQIDEISRDKARAYIRKAKPENDERKEKVMKPFPIKDMEKNVSAFKKMKKRDASIELAGKKAYSIGGEAKVRATEEVELDLEESNGHRVRDDLKSEGKYKEAGEHAYKHGLGRSYGPHFGMRSSKNSAEMEFHKGYDHAQARESKAARLAKEEVELEIVEINDIVDPKDVVVDATTFSDPKPEIATAAAKMPEEELNKTLQTEETKYKSVSSTIRNILGK